MTTLQIVPHARLSPSLRAEILALCTDAYEEDFTPHFEALRDATHLLAIDAGRIVSHAAWIHRLLRVGPAATPLHCAYIEAVATPTALQGRGLGTRVLRALPPLLDAFDLAALSPSEPEFYARSGWTLWRGPLYVRHAGLRQLCEDEQVMYYRLPRTPADLDPCATLEADWRPGEVW